MVSSRKPGLARNSRPIFKTLYCLRQIIKALLCLKYVLKEVLGGLAVTILARPCETLVSREVSSRKVGLARSLVLAKKPSRPCETQLYFLPHSTMSIASFFSKKRPRDNVTDNAPPLVVLRKPRTLCAWNANSLLNRITKDGKELASFLTTTRKAKRPMLYL